MNRFIKLLEADNYNIDTIVIIDTLSFSKWEKLEVIDRIDIDRHKFNSFYAKRKNPLKHLRDNWYPSFRVYEICLEDSLLAFEFEKKVNEFISHKDIYNEKNYDYVVLNQDRLIYVTCEAKLFQEYAFNYKSKLLELIKN